MVAFIEIIVMTLTAAEYISFGSVFFNRKIYKKISWKIVGLLFVAAITVLSGFAEESEIIVPLQISVTFTVIFCIFEITFFDSLKIWLIAFPTLMLLEYIPYMFYSEKVRFSGYPDIISVSFIILLIWLYYFLTKKKYSEDVFILKGKTWIFVSVELFTLFFLVLLFSYPQIQARDNSEIKLAIVVISIVCIVIINLLMLRNYNARYTYKLENDYLDQLNKQQRDYFELLLSKEEDTKRFRHDIGSELIHLGNLLKVGKTESVKSHISEMSSEINMIRDRSYSVGNETVDIILNHFLCPVKESCIVEVKGVLGEDLNISDRDMFIIVSNLLKNAVEEIMKEKNKSGYIKVSASRGKKNTIFKVENSLCHRLSLSRTGLPKTTKPDKKQHGIGLKNVKKTVGQNDGLLNIEITHDTFAAEVVMRLKN